MNARKKVDVERVVRALRKAADRELDGAAAIALRYDAVMIVRRVAVRSVAVAEGRGRGKR